MPEPRTYHRLSGKDLATLRREAGLTQAELARRAAIGRQAVIAWEKKPHIGPWDWAPRRMMEILGVRVVSPEMSPSRTTTRPRGEGVLLDSPYFVQRLARERERLAILAQAQAARHRVLCGAKTRKGNACRLLSEPGRSRCKHHGGLSTGPRTVEGRTRIAEAQQRRWAAWRAASVEANRPLHEKPQS